MKKINFFLLILFIPSILLADINKIKVVDGDTIHIGNIKYRLFGIDAPEIKLVLFREHQYQIGDIYYYLYE